MPFFPSFYARGRLHVAVTMEQNGGGRPSEINRNGRQKCGTLNTIRVMEKNIPPKCRHQRAATQPPPPRIWPAAAQADDETAISSHL